MQVKEWFRPLKEGRTSFESDECSGRPSMSRNQLMMTKCVLPCWITRKITIGELSDNLGLSLFQYSPF
jgi:hypothetical protein